MPSRKAAASPESAQPTCRIARLDFRELQIPFKVAFRHASAARDQTASAWIQATSEKGCVGFGESCPRPYVTSESIDSVRAFFLDHEADIRRHVVDLPSLCSWLAAHRLDVDANPAAWCAIELALLDLAARTAGQTIEALLSLPPLSGRHQYTAVLGDAKIEAFRAMADEYRRRGFTDFKVKLSGDLERDRLKLDVFSQWPDGAARVRVDANNLWTSAGEAIDFLRQLASPVFAIEEPIGSGQYAALAHIGDALDCHIVLDESLLRIEQLELLRPHAARWIVNVRVSKMGGLLRSLALVRAARANGVGLIVGAQVGETSLLTRAGLTVAHAAGQALIAQEGAFGTFLLERDVCTPPLMFGAGGLLDVSAYPTLAQPGFGLDCVVP